MIKHIVLAVFCCISALQATDRMPFGDIGNRTPAAIRSPRTAPAHTKKARENPQEKLICFIEEQLNHIQESTPEHTDITQLACGLARFATLHQEDLPDGYLDYLVKALSQYVLYDIDKRFIVAAQQSYTTLFLSYTVPIAPSVVRRLFE